MPPSDALTERPDYLLGAAVPPCPADVAGRPVLITARKSDWSKFGTSASAITGQTDDLTRAASLARLQMSDDRMVVENDTASAEGKRGKRGRSASMELRRALRESLDIVCSPQMTGGVWAVRLLDRITRDPDTDQAAVIRALEGNRVDVWALLEGRIYRHDSPSDLAAIRVAFARAGEYSGLLSAKLLDSARRKRRTGAYHGGPAPTGYVRDKSAPGGLAPDTALTMPDSVLWRSTWFETAGWIRARFATMPRPCIGTLRRELTEAGGPDIGPGTVRTILTNPVYSGHRRRVIAPAIRTDRPTRTDLPEDRIAALWPATDSVATHRLILSRVAMLADNRPAAFMNPGGARLGSYLTGRISCGVPGCGKPLARHSRESGRETTFSCRTHPLARVSQTDAEAFVNDNVTGLICDAAWLAALTAPEAAVSADDPRIAATLADRAQLEEEALSLETELATGKDADGGRLTPRARAAGNRRLAGIETELNALARSLDAMAPPSPVPPALLEWLASRDARDGGCALWDDSSAEVKGVVLDILTTAVLVGEHRRIGPVCEAGRTPPELYLYWHGAVGRDVRDSAERNAGLPRTAEDWAPIHDRLDAAACRHRLDRAAAATTAWRERQDRETLRARWRSRAETERRAAGRRDNAAARELASATIGRLAARPGGFTTGQLADALGVGASRAGQLISAAVAAGHVARVRSGHRVTYTARDDSGRAALAGWFAAAGRPARLVPGLVAEAVAATGLTAGSVRTGVSDLRRRDGLTGIRGGSRGRITITAWFESAGRPDRLTADMIFEARDATGATAASVRSVCSAARRGRVPG